MYDPRRHPLTTCLLLAAYLAANTLSGLFHDHACDEHGDAQACAAHACAVDHEHGTGCRHAAADHDECAGDHETDYVACLDDDGDGNPLHDDDCAICRFIGQRVMAVETCELDLLCDFSVELAIHCASQTSAPVPRSAHSRAPPLLG